MAEWGFVPGARLLRDGASRLAQKPGVSVGLGRRAPDQRRRGRQRRRPRSFGYWLIADELNHALGSISGRTACNACDPCSASPRASCGDVGRGRGLVPPCMTTT